MAAQPVAVSAPGKVLLAGGYLVLDRAYTGLVFALNARIHVIVEADDDDEDDEEDTDDDDEEEPRLITVTSPQFQNASWTYQHRIAKDGGGVQVRQVKTSSPSDTHPNPFVEKTLAYALTYIASTDTSVARPLKITIIADNDYYSQQNQDEESECDSRFSKYNVPLWEAHKTGLGSSAALVTALTSALLRYYLPKDKLSVSVQEGLSRLHNLSQASHCAAQGKIGSGFDVASAVYGSCLYRRFSPALLDFDGEPGSKGFAATLSALVENKSSKGEWDTEIKKAAVDIPQGVRLVMLDVDCGSKTPGMVKQVLTWRKQEQKEAGDIWNMLHQYNQALAAELLRLSRTIRKDYTTLRELINNIRFWIRTMGRQANVPIEPESQTGLIDACSVLRGVIGGVVPGAGGYDAIALLIEDTPDVEKRLRNLLDNWEVPQATSDGEASSGKARLLGVSGETAGVKEEKVTTYRQWLE